MSLPPSQSMPTLSHSQSFTPSLTSPLTTPPDHHRSDTLPPSYASVPHTSSASANIDSNAEKQALRDARRRMDEEVERSRGLLESSRMPPESVHPASTVSVSNSGSGSHHSGGGSRPGSRGADTTGEGRSTSQSQMLVASSTSLPRQSHDTQNSRMSNGTNGTAAATNENIQMGHRGYLPPGLDVKNALARCEDPTLGWSLQFWVTIADPLTQHVFFACPASGQCSWDPPVGAFVVPRSPDGEWWELADSTRHNRSYYYNTLTSKTQWTRPGGNAFVIPLGLIQRNALPARPGHQNSIPRSSSASMMNFTAPVTPSRERSYNTASSSIPRPMYSPAQSNGMASPGLVSPNGMPITPSRMPEGPASASASSPGQYFPDSPMSPISNSSPTKQRSSTLNPASTIASLTPLSVVDEGSGSEADRSDNSGPSIGGGWWEKRKSKAWGNNRKKVEGRENLAGLVTPGKGKGMPRSMSVERLGLAAAAAALTEASDSQQKSQRKGTIVNGVTSGLPKDMPLEPIYVEQPGSVRTKRMSTGLHPLLPSELSHQIHSFQTDDFSRKYFATKRTGMFRTRVSVERIMEWQKQPITAPLLVLSKHLVKDAVTCFKVIQHVMGERDRPVEGAKPTQSGSSSLAGLPLKGNRAEGDISQRNFAGGDKESMKGRGEKMVVLEEIRWLSQVCVAQSEMRDEIYSQIVKQLTRNPDHDSVVLGFQLFCVFVNSFGPTKNFEPFVENFLEKHLGEAMDGIGIMAKYCISKIGVLSTKGGRAKALTVGEIEHASDAAFYPSVYGECLTRIMELQQKPYPALKVPVILPFLADAILALGGMESEGVFRVPGDGDSVSELRSRMDRGHYQLKGIDDPHVAASLFKLWLRELEEPIIPTFLYNDALTASRSYPEVLALARQLPLYNRRVLVFVISFVQLFMDEKVVKNTKMGPMNLALVMAPNILKTTSTSLVTVFTNSSFESKFILQLLENMKPGEVDPDWVPVHGRGGIE